MNKKTNFWILLFLVIIIGSFLGINTYQAEAASLDNITIISESDYQDAGFDFDVQDGGIEFSSLLRGVIRVSLGFGVLLAIILLIVGGVQYVTVDTFAGKESGRTRITNALLGLILLLISFLILKIINPALISGDKLEIAKVDIDIQEDCIVNDGNPPGFNSWRINSNWKIIDWGWYQGGDDKDTRCLSEGNTCKQILEDYYNTTITQDDQEIITLHGACIACHKTDSDCFMFAGENPVKNAGAETRVFNNNEDYEVFLTSCKPSDGIGALGISLFKKECLDEGGGIVIIPPSNPQADDIIASDADAFGTLAGNQTEFTKECSSGSEGGYENELSDCKNDMEAKINSLKGDSEKNGKIVVGTNEYINGGESIEMRYIIGDENSVVPTRCFLTEGYIMAGQVSPLPFACFFHND